ncbi:MAG: hypothetical protein F4059_05045 [Gemmatimonadetes bacterium]|nr:hypothetical protein [Gemmatimonadota bacterium]
MKYCSHKLSVQNLLIGMCRGSPGVPRAIRRMGYRDRWIPGNLLGRTGTAADPVLVLASAQSRHSFFVEACEGPEMDPARLDRYASMTAVDLRERTPLSQDQTELYGVAVFGLEEHRDTLRSSIRDSKLKPTLLLRTRDGLVMDANPFPKVALANLFRPFLSLDWESAPLGWIAYDHESDLAEVAQAVIPQVIAFAAGGVNRVKIGRVCEDHLLWDLSTRAARRQMRAKVSAALSSAAGHEFSEFFTLRSGALTFSGTAQAAIRAPGSPTLKRMARHHAALLERLAG